MFDIGGGELILLFIIGLLVLGPQRLPKVAAELGKWAGRARRTANELRRQLEREIELSEVVQPPKPPSAPETVAPPSPEQSGAPENAAPENPAPENPAPENAAPENAASRAPEPALEAAAPEETADKPPQA